MLSHSLAGGTGSGMGSLILEQLSEDYGNSAIFDLAVFSSEETETSTTDAYNTILAAHSMLEHSGTTIIVDNKSI